MATTDNTQNNIISAWQDLIEKSVKANTTFLQGSAKIFTDILSKKIETKDLLKLNSEVLSAATNNLIKLNISNTENLVNFGIDISKNIFSFTNVKTNGDSNSDIVVEKVPPAFERSQINLSAQQGKSLSTAFYLNSHNAFSQPGKFYFEDFISESTKETGPITMSILPPDFILEPGKSLKVDITLNLNKDVAPGKYTSTVKLEGMDNQEFDIVLDVTENKMVTKPNATTRPVDAPAKKSVEKKAAAKKSKIKKQIRKK